LTKILLSHKVGVIARKTWTIFCHISLKVMFFSHEFFIVLLQGLRFIIKIYKTILCLIFLKFLNIFLIRNKSLIGCHFYHYRDFDTIFGPKIWVTNWNFRLFTKIKQIDKYFCKKINLCVSHLFMMHFPCINTKNKEFFFFEM